MMKVIKKVKKKCSSSKTNSQLNFKIYCAHHFYYKLSFVTEFNLKIEETKIDKKHLTFQSFFAINPNFDSNDLQILI